MIAKGKNSVASMSTPKSAVTNQYGKGTPKETPRSVYGKDSKVSLKRGTDKVC